MVGLDGCVAVHAKRKIRDHPSLACARRLKGALALLDLAATGLGCRQHCDLGPARRSTKVIGRHCRNTSSVYTWGIALSRLRRVCAPPTLKAKYLNGSKAEEADIGHLINPVSETMREEGRSTSSSGHRLEQMVGRAERANPLQSVGLMRIRPSNF